MNKRKIVNVVAEVLKYIARATAQTIKEEGQGTKNKD